MAKIENSSFINLIKEKMKKRKKEEKAKSSGYPEWMEKLDEVDRIKAKRVYDINKKKKNQ